MRSFLLSLPTRLQVVVVVGSTMFMAFCFALLCSVFFDAQQLKDNTDLISSVYEVMGTIYAILLTFTLWGVWQSYAEAEAAVQTEAYKLMDLVHMIEISMRWNTAKIHAAVKIYIEAVIKDEWVALRNISTATINMRECHHAVSVAIIREVQDLNPKGEREVSIFGQVLQLLTSWMDARRTRILNARGNSARALWPLLITGAAVLFAFNGLFIAESLWIWVTLLAGTSLVIGLTFYLIFSLDCPFAGSPSIDSEPFYLALELLKMKNISPTSSMDLKEDLASC